MFCSWSEDVHVVWALTSNASVIVKNDYAHKLKSGGKKLTIMSKSHAHLQTMNKTSAQFQKDHTKTVRGVALKKYPLFAPTGG